MASTPQAGQVAVGLTGAEARRLLAEIGPNAIAQVRGPSALHQFLAKLTGLFALLLWAGAALALIAGTPELSAAIATVILVNAAFSFFQEHRAQRALAALGEILPLRVRVRRDGAVVEVPNSEVVPGDVLVLSPATGAGGFPLRLPARRVQSWQALPDEGTIYLEATTMTGATIMMAQVGAGLTWRMGSPARMEAGPLLQQSPGRGQVIEVVMLIGLVYTPGLCEVFHTARFAARRWLFLLVWPLAVFGLAEAVKALARPRAARDSAATGGELRSEGSG